MVMACCNGIWYLIERFVFYKECFNKVGLQSVLEGNLRKELLIGKKFTIQKLNVL